MSILPHLPDSIDYSKQEPNRNSRKRKADSNSCYKEPQHPILSVDTWRYEDLWSLCNWPITLDLENSSLPLKPILSSSSVAQLQPAILIIVQSISQQVWSWVRKSPPWIEFSSVKSGRKWYVPTEISSNVLGEALFCPLTNQDLSGANTWVFLGSRWWYQEGLRHRKLQGIQVFQYERVEVSLWSEMFPQRILHEKEFSFLQLLCWVPIVYLHLAHILKQTKMGSPFTEKTRSIGTTLWWFEALRPFQVSWGGGWIIQWSGYYLLGGLGLERWGGIFHSPPALWNRFIHMETVPFFPVRWICQKFLTFS